MINAVTEKKVILFAAKFESNITAKTKIMTWQYVTYAVNYVSQLTRELMI